MTTATLYDVSRLVLSPVVTRSAAAQKQHRVIWGGGVGVLPISRSLATPKLCHVTLVTIDENVVNI